MSTRARRRERLGRRLEEEELDALLVSDLTNVRYLTGYVGSNALALMSGAAATLVTDGRYAVSARAQADVEVVVGRRDLVADLAGPVADLPASPRIGVEADDLTLSRHAAIAAAMPGVELVPVSGLVEDLRIIKDEEERALLRRSAAIADEALGRVVEGGLVGRREADVALDIERALREAGAEGSSFAPIVAAGPRGALPHAVPTGEPIPDDTLLVIDMGAVLEGYCSDMTRTFILGDPPGELKDAYRVCHAAQRAAVDAARAGLGTAALDAVARDVIRDAGLGPAFAHGLGHGVGLDIHERPGVRAEGDETLREGMAITIEPGIYLEGIGGVRIEDLVLVTDGAPEVVSGYPIAEPPR